MPYIEKSARYRAETDPLGTQPGELNYAVTNMVLNWLDGRTDYASMNAAIGALECAKLEMYRRLVAPVEDVKCRQNGDVYPTLHQQRPVQNHNDWVVQGPDGAARYCTRCSSFTLSARGTVPAALPGECPG